MQPWQETFETRSGIYWEAVLQQMPILIPDNQVSYPR